MEFRRNEVTSLDWTDVAGMKSLSFQIAWMDHRSHNIIPPEAIHFARLNVFWSNWFRKIRERRLKISRELLGRKKLGAKVDKSADDKNGNSIDESHIIPRKTQNIYFKIYKPYIESGPLSTQKIGPVHIDCKRRATVSSRYGLHSWREGNVTLQGHCVKWRRCRW